VNGQDVGLAQLDAGLAWWYRKYAHEQPPQSASTTKQRRIGRRLRIGLWQDKDPMPPWAWRHRRPPQCRCCRRAVRGLGGRGCDVRGVGTGATAKPVPRRRSAITKTVAPRPMCNSAMNRPYCDLCINAKDRMRPIPAGQARGEIFPIAAIRAHQTGLAKGYLRRMETQAEA
jgi:hypothetical protein